MTVRPTAFRAVVFVVACLSASAAFGQGRPDWIWSGGGHSGIPYARLTPDGATLVSGASQDTTLKIWNTADGRLVRTLVYNDGEVNAVAVSPNGANVATAGEMVFGSGISPVVLWRISDGAFLRTFTGNPDNTANSVAISPDGTEIAAGEGQSVYVWRISDGALLHTLSGHTWFIFSIAYSPDGQHIATASGDDTVKIWRRSTGALERTLSGHTFFVSGVAWSPDSTRVATSSWDKTSRIYNAQTGALITSFTDTDALYAVDWAPGGGLVAVAGVTRLIHLYNPANGALVRNVTNPDMTDVYSLDFSNDGNTVVSGSSEGHPRSFRVSDGVLLRRYGTHTGRVDSVACSPTGPEVASSGPESTQTEQTIKIWDRTSGTLLRQLVGHSDEIGQVTFSRDGTLLASAAGHLGTDISADHTIKLWNPSTGALIRTLPGHGKVSWRVAFSPDGATLASGGEEATTNDMKIWRVSDGALLNTIGSLPDLPRWLVYTPNGQFLLVGLSTEIRYYQPPNYALVQTVPVGNGVECLSLSPDGTLMAVAMDAYGNNVALRRVSDGALLWTAAGHPDGFCQSVAFSPDAQTIVSASGFSRDMRIWRASDGAQLQLYDQEMGWGIEPLLPVAIDPTGAEIIHGRTDATVIAARHPFGPAVDLRAVRNSVAGTVHLSWSGGLAPFTLRRARDPKFTQDVHTLLDHQPATSFDDPVLNDGMTYFYLVN